MGLSDFFDGDGSDLPDELENTVDVNDEAADTPVVEHVMEAHEVAPVAIEPHGDAGRVRDGLAALPQLPPLPHYEDETDGEIPLVEFIVRLSSDDERLYNRPVALVQATADAVMLFAQAYGQGEVGTVIVDEAGVMIPITAPSDAESQGFVNQAAVTGSIYVGAANDIRVDMTVTQPGAEGDGTAAGFAAAVARTAGRDDVTTVRSLYQLNDGPLSDTQAETAARGSIEFLTSQGFAPLRIEATEHTATGTIVTFSLDGEDNPERPLRLLCPDTIVPAGPRRFTFGTVHSFALPG